MGSVLSITIRFLQPWSHGRGEDDCPEWPPSPLRVMQALVAASAGRWNERSRLEHAVPALRWLETLPPPRIIAAPAVAATEPYRLYVPDNVADKVAAAWSRGRYDANIAEHRTEKDVRPCALHGEAVHYLYTLPDDASGLEQFIDVIGAAARSITHLGWGIDMTVGEASTITVEQSKGLQGTLWQPSDSGGTSMRVPRVGTLDDLMRKHADFLHRVTAEGFQPVPPLRTFEVIRYRSQHEPVRRPCRVFELRDLDGSRYRYPQRRLVHIAGMVRHLAIRATASPLVQAELYRDHEPARGHSVPPGIEEADDWVRSWVAGHMTCGGLEHRQLSYLPLPTIGHEHADPGVRRVMIAAPVGDDAWLEHVARRIAGQQLRPLQGDEFGDHDPPLLVPLPRTGDGVTRCYTGASSEWHTVTPVILPGHDDQKPEKTLKLILKALAQAGIEQPCEFEWSAFSRFRNAYSAHKYDRNGPQGYIRPGHLLTQTAVHLTLRFHDGSADQNPIRVPGPIVIGAGRHCGLGLFANMS